MYPLSFAKLVAISLTIGSGVLAGEAVSGPGPDKVRDALDSERVLRAFHDRKQQQEESGGAEKVGGMILVAGPVSTTQSLYNPFMAMFKNRHHSRHSRRHRIHRRPHLLFTRHGFFAAPVISRPKTFLEIMKVRERVVVDEQNRPKSAELSLTNDLMQVDPVSGKVKLMRHGELSIKPKKPLDSENSNNSNNISDAFISTEFISNKQPQDGSRLDRFIRFLHLDQFWPLFLFSAACGFSFVGLTFLAAKAILGFIDDPERDSYEAVPTDENLLDSIESAQPIRLTNEMIQVDEQTTLNHQDNQ